MDETTGTVIRKAADAIVNPLDLYAVEVSLQLKEKYGAEIFAFSMGPPSAAAALREVLSMGVDSACLISDPAFGGSDTWATAHILSETIKKIVPDVNLILCGERATDGDTGQVGPEVASALDIPVVAYVAAVGGLTETSDAKELELTRSTEYGQEEIRLRLPALITVLKSVASPRLPTLDRKIQVRKAKIPVYTQKDLHLDPGNIGLKGSPTRIVKTFRPQIIRHCTIKTLTDESSLQDAVTSLVTWLQQKELV